MIGLVRVIRIILRPSPIGAHHSVEHETFFFGARIGVVSYRIDKIVLEVSLKKINK